MSPIKAEMELQDRKLQLPDIDVGRPGSFTDFDPEDPHVLVVSCNPDDSGVLIYRQNIENTGLSHDRAIRFIRNMGDIIEAVIPLHESYERSIQTKDGSVIIKFTHY